MGGWICGATNRKLPASQLLVMLINVIWGVVLTFQVLFTVTNVYKTFCELKLFIDQTGFSYFCHTCLQFDIAGLTFDNDNKHKKEREKKNYLYKKKLLLKMEHNISFKLYCSLGCLTGTWGPVLLTGITDSERRVRGGLHY